jgi:hypothetical protein
MFNLGRIWKVLPTLDEMEATGRAYMGKPMKDESGVADMSEVIVAIIAIVIGAILIGALLPTAINSVAGGVNGSWSTSLQSTYNAIPILIAVAGLLIFVAIVIRLTKG